MVEITAKEQNKDNISIKQLLNGSGKSYTIISLKINELNSQIKRHRMEEWKKKQDPAICCLQETHFRYKGVHSLK